MEYVILGVAVLVILAVSGVFYVRGRKSRGYLEPPKVSGSLLGVAATTAVAEASPATLRGRLGKTRGIFTTLRGASSQSTDDEAWFAIEEALLRADVGVAVTRDLVKELRKRVANTAVSMDELLAGLESLIVERLDGRDRGLQRGEPSAPTVWLFVGVNGVGKTTTIGKVGLRETEAGQKVVMAAGDTFRAAASEQLAVWADRCGAEVVRGQPGGDPGAVVYDAVQAAAARGIPLVLGDTAGRLQNKINLMEELRKVKRIAEKPPAQLTEVLLVLDATTGQNGLQQAKVFAEAVDCTGVVLTKLDGSARGGIALGIELEYGLPVKLVGIGEANTDLIDFDPKEYAKALFA